MRKFLVAVSYGNEQLDGIVVAKFPFDGFEKIRKDCMLEHKDEFYNLEMTENLDLVGTSGDINRYTVIKNGDASKLSLTVLAESENNSGKIYFVTDGLELPKWKNIEEIMHDLEHKGIKLSNSKIDFDNRCLKSLGEKAGKGFEEVDFLESQLEYRRYIKGLKQNS